MIISINLEVEGITKSDRKKETLEIKPDKNTYKQKIPLKAKNNYRKKVIKEPSNQEIFWIKFLNHSRTN